MEVSTNLDANRGANSVIQCESTLQKSLKFELLKAAIANLIRRHVPLLGYREYKFV